MYRIVVVFHLAIIVIVAYSPLQAIVDCDILVIEIEFGCYKTELDLEEQSSETVSV
jgi:hypothetical protein